MAKVRGTRESGNKSQGKRKTIRPKKSKLKPHLKGILKKVPLKPQNTMFTKSKKHNRDSFYKVKAKQAVIFNQDNLVVTYGLREPHKIFQRKLIKAKLTIKPASLLIRTQKQPPNSLLKKTKTKH